jgi:cell division septum initiation protein DivIVA
MRVSIMMYIRYTLLVTCLHASASSTDHSPTALAELQTKADQAQLRDRCFLYVKLISQMTDLASKQLSSGDSREASETLKVMQRYAAKIHTNSTDDSKKLKDAELMMQHTSLRLKGMLNRASYEDRPVLESTLEQLNQIQRELLTRVVRK